MIECAGVTVDLGGRRVLHSVGVSVARGEWLALVGTNGAGKTTLLRYVAGLVPGDGTLRIDGHPAAALPRRDRSRLVALVPQVPVVPEGMRVLDYVLLGRTPHIPPMGFEGPHDLAAAHEALARLELVDLADRVVATLSGGERQRVLVARALAQAAPIMLLDEPTTALDIGHQQQVLELVDTLRHERDLTIVMTMHDLTLAAQYADRLVLLHGGRVVIDGSAADVLTEANLARYFDARVRIVRDGGGPAVLPLRRVSERSG